MQSRHEKVTFLAVVLGAALVLVSFGMVACGTPEDQEPQPFYSHANFSRNGQFYVYTQDGLAVQKTGVDVSDHQGWIDWQAVAQSGIQFAYIRAGYRGSTEGELYTDEYFSYNMEAAKEAGIERGVYFFSQAITADEAREEAQFVLELLDGAKLDYPVAFDFERSSEGIQSRVADLSSEEASAVAEAFCDALSAGGYEVCLYGNGHDLGLYSSDLRETWPLWYAEYGALPAYTEKFFLWQYASDGSVNGIDTPVDLNLDFGTILQD